MSRPSADRSSGGATLSCSKMNLASRSKEKMCSRVKPEISTAGEQLAFELERGLLGREQDQRRAGGIFSSAARASARQRKVLPLPAGPRRKRACTGYFHAKARRRKGIYCE
jgi:hypothetical protein